jgi:hypothetical protein
MRRILTRERRRRDELSKTRLNENRSMDCTNAANARQSSRFWMIKIVRIDERARELASRAALVEMLLCVSSF